jgi:uncharacterized membrane protein YfcA
VAVVLATVAVGVGAGILSALLGVGGAVITTPAVRVLGASPIDAVGSTVPAILPSAVVGSIRYSREGLVVWRVALTLGISGSALAVAGAWVANLVGGPPLMVVTAVLMLWSGVSVMRSGRTAAAPSTDAAASTDAPATTDHGLLHELEGVEASESDSALAGHPRPAADVVPRWPLGLLVALGAASGFVAGLLGVGGGIVMVPVMTGPLRFPMRAAVASSLVAVAIFSVPALVTHALLGHIDWSYALPLMLGVIPGARIGSHLTVAASDRTVRRLFGALIVVLGVVYGVTEASALF